MKKTCYSLDGNHLTFHGAHDGRVLGICCEVINEALIPGIKLENTPVKNFKNWKKLVTQLREESDYELCDRKVSAACFHCPKLVQGQTEPSEKIKLINISIYPAPCQAGCIYCDLRSTGKFDLSDKERVNEIYRNIIELCKYLKENNKIADDAMFYIASGEIAIHPFKKELLEIVGEMTAWFYSNGMKFDEGVAKKLSQNPLSKMIVSLDCGTSKTWNIIKRRNNFKKTLDNLAKYLEYTSGEGQIVLKYIVMPGINTSDEDFDGIIEIMKNLKVFALTLSRNYDEGNEKRPELIHDLKRLVKKLVQNNLGWADNYALSDDEIKVLEEYELELKELICEQETAVENFEYELEKIRILVAEKTETFENSQLFPLDYFMSDLYYGYKYAYENLADSESRRVLVDIMKRYLLGTEMTPSSEVLKYFANDIIQLTNDEIFVDGGAFYGNTVDVFVKKYDDTSDSYKQIYAFEPDGEAYAGMKQQLNEFANVEIINQGLWSENAELSFNKIRLGTASAVFNHGNETITAPVITLDSFFKDKPESNWPTFIKLDVIGSEQRVLHGAKKIITTKRPKLAISAHYWPDDVFRLIKIAQMCNANYEFTLRQHGEDFYSHVLYCVDKSSNDL